MTEHDGNQITVTVTRHKLSINKETTGPYPSLNVFTVEVSTRLALWPETFGTEAEKKAFIRGVEAGASMHGDFSVRVKEEQLEDATAITQENKAVMG